MLHYAGDEEAFALGERAKFYIPLYEKKGKATCYVAFRDLQLGRKRFVKFERIKGVDGWVFVDLVDKEG